MDFVMDQLQLLGLNEREVRVFAALSTFGQQNMTSLAARAKVPRTTADAIVHRLIDQGLVCKNKVQRHYEYTVSLSDVHAKLERLQKRLSLSNADDVCTSGETTQQLNKHPQHTDEEIVITDCKRLHPQLLEDFVAHQGERATMLVSTLNSTLERVVRLEHCFSYAHRASLKLDILTTVDIADSLSGYATELVALLAAYDLRLNILPPSFCIENIDLVVFRDLVLVVDHAAGLVERIEGARAVRAINHLLFVAREAGWGMDLKTWLGKHAA